MFADDDVLGYVILDAEDDCVDIVFWYDWLIDDGVDGAPGVALGGMVALGVVDKNEDVAPPPVVLRFPERDDAEFNTELFRIVV
jgi:hypothetical protein